MDALSDAIRWWEAAEQDTAAEGTTKLLGKIFQFLKVNLFDKSSFTFKDVENKPICKSEVEFLSAVTRRKITPIRFEVYAQILDVSMSNQFRQTQVTKFFEPLASEVRCEVTKGFHDEPFLVENDSSTTVTVEFGVYFAFRNVERFTKRIFSDPWLKELLEFSTHKMFSETPAGIGKECALLSAGVAAP